LGVGGVKLDALDRRHGQSQAGVEAAVRAIDALIDKLSAHIFNDVALEAEAVIVEAGGEVEHTIGEGGVGEEGAEPDRAVPRSARTPGLSGGDVVVIIGAAIGEFHSYV